jgi:hypothetical protein
VVSHITLQPLKSSVPVDTSFLLQGTVVLGRLYLAIQLPGKLAALYSRPSFKTDSMYWSLRLLKDSLKEL